jgi:hypothetical protein
MALLANIVEPWWMALIVEVVVPVVLTCITWRQYGTLRQRRKGVKASKK